MNYLPIGVLQQQITGGGGGSLPTTGLLCQLDGSVALSFYSDIAKTTNSTEGGEVAVWEDQSGNGNDWVQTTSAYRPLANLSAGRLYNDGTAGAFTSKHLTGPNISAWTTGSFFGRIQVVNNEQGAIWGATSWSHSDSTGHWNFSSKKYVCFATNTRPIGWTWGSGGFPSSTTLMTFESNCDASGVTTYFIGGTQLYSSDLGNTGFRSVPYLGCGVRSNISQYSIGAYYYKFCAYNRVVDGTERASINAWLES